MEDILHLSGEECFVFAFLGSILGAVKALSRQNHKILILVLMLMLVTVALHCYSTVYFADCRTWPRLVVASSIASRHAKF